MKAQHCKVMSYLGILLSTTMSVATIKGQTSTPIPVTAENFIRAESDLYFGAVVKRNGFGKFEFTRTPSLIEEQTVVRMNRDTLYGAAIFDLDAGPVSSRCLMRAIDISPYRSSTKTNTPIRYITARAAIHLANSSSGRATSWLRCASWPIQMIRKISRGTHYGWREGATG